MASESARDVIRTPSPLPINHLQLHDHRLNATELRKYAVKAQILINSALAINKLPPELFADILELIRVNCPRKWSFVTVLLVCHHWYHSAVSFPRLWTRLTSSMPLRILETYLRRSRGASLSLVTNSSVSAAVPQDTMRALSPHFERVVHLDTYSIQPYVQHRMERLYSLIIDDCITLPLSLAHHSTSSSRQTIVIRGDHFPRLCSLKLYGLRMPASLVNVNSLTSLEVEEMSASQLLDLLRNCPALTCLEIESPTGHPMAIPMHDGQHIVELPHLQNLVLTSFDDRVIFGSILAHLSLPRSVRVEISAAALGTEDFYVAGYAELRGLVIAAGFIPDDKTYWPLVSSIRKVETLISKTCLQIVASMPIAREPRIDMRSSRFRCDLYALFNTSHIQKQIMLELGTIFPRSLTALKIIVADADHYENQGGSVAESWRRLYDAFPEMEDLDIGGPTIDFFTDFLFDIGPSPPPPAHAPIPWPKLKYLRLEYTGSHGADSLDEPEEGLVMQAITTTICNRRDAASIERLQRLAIVFPTEPPHLWTYLGLLRSATEELVCTIDGQDLVLDDEDARLLSQ